MPITFDIDIEVPDIVRRSRYRQSRHHRITTTSTRRSSPPIDTAVRDRLRNEQYLTAQYQQQQQKSSYANGYYQGGGHTHGSHNHYNNGYDYGHNDRHSYSHESRHGDRYGRGGSSITSGYTSGRNYLVGNDPGGGGLWSEGISALCAPGRSRYEGRTGSEREHGGHGGHGSVVTRQAQRPRGSVASYIPLRERSERYAHGDMYEITPRRR